VVKLLSELGAQVTMVEPARGDPFEDVYPAYRHWKRHCAGSAPGRLGDLLAAAGVCVLGGEARPDVAPVAAGGLSEIYPSLVVLQLGGYLDEFGRGLPAVEFLAQAKSGLVFELHEAEPYPLSFQPGLYGSALAGLCVVLAALIERRRSGLGQVVRTDLLRGFSVFFPAMWMPAEPQSEAFDVYPPRGAKQLIFRCRDGEVHSVGSRRPRRGCQALRRPRHQGRGRPGRPRSAASRTESAQLLCRARSDCSLRRQVPAR
jgi:hypothetical protein